MYCGKKIDLNDLFGNKKYDLDHILPRSKKMDDSINNNLVLVCREHNQEKSDQYPLPEGWQSRMKPTWLYLKDNGFITSEKYDRLVRTSPLTEDELAGFINRQLVETSQTVKAVIELMKMVFGNKTDVVYVKANAISDFRNGNNGYKASEEDPDLKFIKCRSVNDYHHAKDAYLNIVVGNVYDMKFTKDFSRFVRSGEKYSLRLDKLLTYDIERGGEFAWRAGNEGTIKTVSKYMNRNNILFTRFAYEVKGQLFDLLPLKKGMGQLPLKKELPIEKYGGYNNICGSYFALIEQGNEKKRIRTI
jgi:CRISPR-associated endonuclease Csn1